MRRSMEEAGMNMTPMIDVVFQLIIFFVTTVDMQNKALDTKIRLAMAPHGPAVEKKDPREVMVDVDGGRADLHRARVHVAGGPAAASCERPWPSTARPCPS